jgi:hypothetical protein
MVLSSGFVSFVSCLDTCIDAVGVRPPIHSKYHCNYNTYKVFSSQTDFQLNIELSSKLVPLITHRHGPRRKQSSSIVVVQLLLVKNLLTSNCCCHAVSLSLSINGFIRHNTTANKRQSVILGMSLNTKVSFIKGAPDK